MTALWLIMVWTCPRKWFSCFEKAIIESYSILVDAIILPDIITFENLYTDASKDMYFRPFS